MFCWQARYLSPWLIVQVYTSEKNTYRIVLFSPEQSLNCNLETSLNPIGGQYRLKTDFVNERTLLYLADKCARFLLDAAQIEAKAQ